MKYILKSQYGNVITSTDSERHRDRLLSLGYTLEEAPEKQKNKPPKKET